MLLDPELRGNVRRTGYEAGHMFYSEETQLRRFKEDFRAFVGDLKATR